MVEEVNMDVNQEIAVAEEKSNAVEIHELKKTLSTEEQINNSEPIEESNGHDKAVDLPIESNDEKPAEAAPNTEETPAVETPTVDSSGDSETPAIDNNVSNKEATTTETPAETTTKEGKKEEGKKEDSQKAVNGDDKNEAKAESLGATVAQHYNARPAGSKDTRKDSRIFHLRNFNNWAKSTLIHEFLEKIKRRKRTSDDIVILDLACGKGGDLLKWQKGKVDHVIMADIASTSIDQCKERYARLEKEARQSRNRDRLFTMEAFAADCTKENIAETHYKKKDVKIDLTSCQFAFHYAFESYDQAVLMVKNACEKLNTGGYWIGTMPDANLLVKKTKASEDGSFGNSVFKITPDDKDDISLFGSKYMFHLEGVVDCPEFLVHFPVVEKLASKYGMKLVWKKNFHELYKYMEKDHASLMHRMSALECYPAASGKELAAEEEDAYAHAKEYMTEKGVKKVGTLTKDEWEAAGLYCAFAFEKVESGEKKVSSKSESERSGDRKRTRDSSSSRSDRHVSRDSSRKDSRGSRERSKSRTANSDSDRKRSSGSSSHRSSSSKRIRKDTEEEQPEFIVADAIECADEDDTTTEATETTDVAMETPVEEATPAVEAAPDVEETPAVEETPVEETSAVEETEAVVKEAPEAIEATEAVVEASEAVVDEPMEEPSVTESEQSAEAVAEDLPVAEPEEAEVEEPVEEVEEPAEEVDEPTEEEKVDEPSEEEEVEDVAAASDEEEEEEEVEDKVEDKVEEEEEVEDKVEEEEEEEEEVEEEDVAAASASGEDDESDEE